jgi:hypothetical protein
MPNAVIPSSLERPERNPMRMPHSGVSDATTRRLDIPNVGPSGFAHRTATRNSGPGAHIRGSVTALHPASSE